MTLTAKKLAQTSLNSVTSAIVTPTANSKVYITSFRLVNTSTTDKRKVTLYAHGNEAENTILIFNLDEEGVYAETKNEAQIVLTGKADILYAKQDSGNDVVITVYGVEEV